MATVTRRDDRTDRRETPTAEPLRVNPLLERAARWLDESIAIPGLQRRIGFDGIIGLIPGVGDAVTLVSAAVVLKEAKRLGMTRLQRARIVGYYALDAVFGAVPLLGDLFDFFFKANKRSLRLLHRHAEKVNRERGLPNP
jgi:hypothetical protein